MSLTPNERMPTDMMSDREKFDLLPPARRLKILEGLNDEQVAKLQYDWDWLARPKQLPPDHHKSTAFVCDCDHCIDEEIRKDKYVADIAAGRRPLDKDGRPLSAYVYIPCPTKLNWLTWVVLAGRGFGKTRIGAEWVRGIVASKKAGRIAIISPTSADARDVVVEGESGIMSICPNWDRPTYEPTKRRLTWNNGAIATLYSSQEPDRLRGPQHDAAWCLVGETLVATNQGEIRIDQLTLDHKVWTPWGLRKIKGVTCTNKEAEVHTFSFTSGIIKGTKEHLAYSEGTFKPLGEISCVTYVENIKERCITSAAVDGMSWEGLDWLESYMNMKLVRFPRFMKSIIRTLTARMIQLRIWKFSRQQNTLKNIREQEVNSWLTDMTPLQWSPTLAFSVGKNFQENSGLVRLLNSVLHTVSTSIGILQHSFQKNGIAKYVVRNTWRKGIFRNTVRTNVTTSPTEKISLDHLFTVARFKSVERSPRLEPVYDIAVDGGVFCANGIIVHNCDEIAGWELGSQQETWDMLQFGLRLGVNPKCVVTTTPKPTVLIQNLVDMAKDPVNRLLITTGSSYENRSNLAAPFMRQIAQYEGTNLGRQEIHAELIDIEESGIVKRQWIKRWSAKDPLPFLEYVIQSYDTAFTDKTQNDPTACTVWGIFRPTDSSPHCVILLDAWREYLKYPELRMRCKEDYKAKYGDARAPVDIVLIEEKGSGIPLIQDLQRAGVYVRPYNPGKPDKIMRLHSVSHLAYNGRVYIPESRKVPGEIVSWAEEFVRELCGFPNSPHDDYVDTFSQAMALLRDQDWVYVDTRYNPDDDEVDYTKKRRSTENPYAM